MLDVFIKVIFVLCYFALHCLSIKSTGDLTTIFRELTVNLLGSTPYGKLDASVRIRGGLRGGYGSSRGTKAHIVELTAIFA